MPLIILKWKTGLASAHNRINENGAQNLQVNAHRIFNFWCRSLTTL